MRRPFPHVSWRAIAAALLLSGAQGCARGPSTTPYEERPGNDAGTTPALVPEGGPCVGLECQRVSCPQGGDTTVSGTVLSPNMDNGDPIYNAIVYIPNEPLKPFMPGVACDRCNTTMPESVVGATVTASDGTFVLKNAPVGREIPLVIQVGRWRRQLTMPPVVACTDNPVPKQLTHLPGNQKDGDIPHIAIATGAVDPLECVLLKMGVDQSEFTTPDKGGRIHIYQSDGSPMAGATPPASNLWSSLDTLKKYDTVLLPCEGQPVYKPAAATQNLIDYTAAGGRVFTTHYGYVWIQGAQAPFSGTASWSPDQGQVADPLPVSVNTSFPKGQALAEWLYGQEVSGTLGQLQIEGARRDATQTNGSSLSWLTSVVPAPSVQEFTFDTPVDVPTSQQCGRVAYSDFHVSIDGIVTTATSNFPVECMFESSVMTPQEKVIEFLLFDLVSCIQDETQPPMVTK